jgi:hypothetical protein
MRAKWEAKVAEEKRSRGGFGSGSGSEKKYHNKFDKSKIDYRNCREFRDFADE